MQKPSKKGGLTRGKAISIGVLAVVLVGILYVQFGSSSEKLGSETVAYRPPRRPVITPAAGSSAKTSNVTLVNTTAGREHATAQVIDEKRWKSPDLASVIAYDPFELPATFPQPLRVTTDAKTGSAEGLIAAAAADDAKKMADAVGKLRMQLKELEQRGVTVIIRERDQYAAMIGDRMLHVGDEINGFTVTAIDRNGVLIERKKSP